MVVDLQSLKKEIEEYPNKLRIALLQERELERKIETLQEEIDKLDDTPPPLPTRPSILARHSMYSTIHSDAILTKLKRDMERLRQRKLTEVAKNPTAYGLTTKSTQKMIDATVAQDSEVETLQRQIEERQDLLQQQAEQQENIAITQPENQLNLVNTRELERKQKELEKVEKALQEASVEREVIEHALPRMYELLVQLSQVK